ncbi:50S ribosomal protein L16 [Candidatus Pacearchaeota archaeon]|nr:50S ribosomal protein L16 [Candidatus Pacearchaeota archaeon]
MALRKALAYSKKKARPYTRNSRKKGKSYIKTIPFSKIVKFDSGVRKDYEQGKFPYKISLEAEEGVQVRDNALEACRMLLTKQMDENALGQYFLMVKVHPHHFIRENKSAAAVAGADRISTGMTQSFGVVIGRAARVKPGQELFFISAATEKGAQAAKSALNMIRSKVPCKSRVVFQKAGQ